MRFYFWNFIENVAKISRSLVSYRFQHVEFPFSVNKRRHNRKKYFSRKFGFEPLIYVIKIKILILTVKIFAVQRGHFTISMAMPKRNEEDECKNREE